MTRTILTTATVIAMCFYLVADNAMADQPQDRQPGNTFNRDAGTTERQASQTDDKKVPDGTVRASEIIGMNIVNSSDENLGEVNDLVIDKKTGRVRYAAVTYGGFLGVGGKMFAVPFEAFQHRTSPEDRDEHQLVLDVTQKQLEGAEGFDDNNWPNFADRNITSELDRRYDVERREDYRVGTRDTEASADRNSAISDEEERTEDN